MQMPNDPAKSETTIAWAEEEIIDGSDYPGEAAERIAAYRGCSFEEAMKVVEVVMEAERVGNPGLWGTCS